MNLIPLTYQKVAYRKKWLSRLVTLLILGGFIGSTISTMLPFKVQVLQVEIKQLQQNEAFKYKEEREELLNALYNKQQQLKCFEEQRGHLEGTKATYLLDFDDLMSLVSTELILSELSYNMSQGMWTGIGKSKDLDSIRKAQKTLENRYGSLLINFQIEKNDQGWAFYFEVNKNGVAEDAVLE